MEGGWIAPGDGKGRRVGIGGAGKGGQKHWEVLDLAGQGAALLIPFEHPAVVDNMASAGHAPGSGLDAGDAIGVSGAADDGGIGGGAGCRLRNLDASIRRGQGG